MKVIILSLLLIVGLSSLRAGTSDVEIHVIPKRLSATAPTNEADNTRTVSKEHWNYEVTVENKAFKSLAAIEVKYVTFYKTEQLGSKAEAKTERQAGSISIDALQPHAQKVFSTNSVELNKSHLTGHWYFSGGERIKAEDTLTGIWVRVFQSGQQIGEYANPTTLITQQKWE